MVTRLLAWVILLALPAFGQEVQGGPVLIDTALGVSADSWVSQVNSTASSVASGETWAGGWQFVYRPSLMVTGRADQDGQLYIEFSPDGVNADSSINGSGGIPTFANIPFFHQIEVGGRYVRIRWTNDGASATDLRLNTAYGQFGKLTANMGGTVSQYADAVVTRPLPFHIPVALDLVTGYDGRDKFGRNPEIDNSAATYPEDIWAAGGLYTGQPATCPGETGEVLSSDADDTNASGSGARTILLVYLDDDFNEVTETLNLAGATPAVTSSNMCRLYRARVVTAGASENNEGTLTIRNTTTTANVYAQIAVGVGQTEVGAFTVPAGFTAILNKIELSITRASGAAGSATVRLYVRETGTNQAYAARKTYDVTTGSALIVTYEGFTLPEKTDFRPRVDFVSDNDTVVAMELGFFLVKNN